ncbi:putative hydrolase, CocE/NonD family [Amycolatopsis xylanica]|uniref:Putative hydrolase, CocE/NonD family n=1 Tax=Amycolatopsis xylanica TaxID=589385 RepID=A0A1H2SEK0_9PSEU|nr:putative hydrolase, CocE/NonD family [Amycolatopsis xylanica]
MFGTIPTADIPVSFHPVKIGVAEDPEFPGRAVELDACVALPENAQPAEYPLIVLPAPLAPIGWRAYAVFHPLLKKGFMANLAAKGYVVVAYSERGLAQSDGKIDVAGPRDQADGTAVIDWVAEHIQAADMSRVGMAGASYGAGQSLLIAAKDKRVKAVVAMSAWGDLFTSLYENETRHIKAFHALRDLFQTWPGPPSLPTFPPQPQPDPMPGVSRLNPETEQVFQNIVDNVEIKQLRAYADKRSPIQPEFLDELNRPDLAILLCTYWHETIFSNNAVVALFNSLTGDAKKLIVQVGDHGNAEGTGLAGEYSRPTVAAMNWFDLYLRDEGSPETEPVVVETMPYPYADARRYRTWADFTHAPVRFHLHQPSPDSDGGLDSQGTGTSWSHTIQIEETSAEIADTLVQRGISERLAQFYRYSTRNISRKNAAIWSCPPFGEDQRISGEVRLRLTVTPQTEHATIVAYLFDVTAEPFTIPPGKNFDRIITSAAYTVLDREPGVPVTIEVPFQLTNYLIRAGRFLRLVVDTKDKFLADANADSTTLTVSSTEEEPAYITIPIAANT